MDHMVWQQRIGVWVHCPRLATTLIRDKWRELFFGPRNASISSLVKSSSNTPSHAKDKARAHNKTVRVTCLQKFSLAACPSGRRAGWAVRRFGSLVLSEIPGVFL